MIYQSKTIYRLLPYQFINNIKGGIPVDCLQHRESLVRYDAEVEMRDDEQQTSVPQLQRHEHELQCH